MVFRRYLPNDSQRGGRQISADVKTNLLEASSWSPDPVLIDSCTSSVMRENSFFFHEESFNYFSFLS